MMNDLRQFTMMNVKEPINETMKEFMKEMTVSIRSNIVESMNTQPMINNQTNLSPMSQLEPITQDSPHLTPPVEDLNDLIEEMEIEKTPKKRKAPKPSNETENQNETQEVVNNKN